jgi:lipoprotein NlpI/transglutaminase-like putative cysteine protease
LAPFKSGLAAERNATSESGKFSSTGFSFVVEPKPLWIVPATEPSGVVVEQAQMHYRLIDDQMLLDGKTQWFHSHVVRVVDQPGGLATASQIEVEFDPTFQTLALHQLDVIRKGKRISKLNRKRIQLLQRETQLERRIYDGRVTASIVLDDVRVGDEIEFDYSIKGANPVFDGRFVGFAWMASMRGPVAYCQYRLVTPQARNILYRVGAPDTSIDVRSLGGLRETVFKRRSIPQFRFDPGAPYSALLNEQVQFSEYQDWADVARWGRLLFAEPPGDAPSLDRQAAAIREQTTDPAEQLLQALQFVQKEIRYFGTEIGASTHRPATPEHVMSQRFGDCKDKVALLIALLKRLNFPAVPVLVSVAHRQQVGELLPSPLAFDHVIARVELNGATYWLDGTRSHQTGNLLNRQSFGFEKGLPLAVGTSLLADLPSSTNQLRMAVQDTFHVRKFSDDVELESRITYRGDLAELLREALATGRAQVEAESDDPYVGIYPKARTKEPLKFEESEGDDALIIVQRFVIPDFWHFPEQRVLAADLAFWSIADAIRIPNEQSRRHALMIPFPGIFSHRIVIEYPEDVFESSGARRFDDGDRHFEYRSKAESTLRRVQYEADLRLVASAISADEWSAYVTKLTTLFPRLGFAAVVPTMSLPLLESTAEELRAIGNKVRSGRVKASTKMQQTALARSIWLTGALEGGRLSASLKAQALRARGISYDELDRPSEARTDLESALAIQPDDKDTLNAAAVNAVARGDYVAALALTEKVLTAYPSETEARYTHAKALYLSGDFRSASAELKDLLKDQSLVRRGYPLVFLYLTTLNIKGEGKADIDHYVDGAAVTDWPRPLVDWAIGKTTEEEVFKSARRGENSSQQLCEAYFYLGEHHLAAGDERRAKNYFREAIDQGVTEFFEHAAARNQLRRLERR